MPEEKVEQQVAKQVVEGEYLIAKTNADSRNTDFEAAIDMLECERVEKKYDWMSDIFIPEFPSHVLTQSSMDVAQYFTTRDFVEVYLEDGSEEAKAKAEAAKELLNRTLNQKHLHYYMKFIRARVNNNLGGYVYARCWWERETEPITVIDREVEELDVDNEGNPIFDRETQIPARVVRETPREDKKIIFDRFNFDVIDSRNVFTDNSYVYTLQDKPWVIVRFEQTYQELLEAKDRMGYINLNKLKDELRPPEETETSRDSYNEGDHEIPTQRFDPNKSYDIIERHGKFWVRFGKDGKVSPGIDEEGMPYDDAKYLETIITYALSGNSRQLIRFQLQPYRAPNGRPFRPLIRGLCYIHPTKDYGLGDGKFSRELQIAINDTFNISQDRVMLATLPTLKGRRNSIEDNTTVYIEPQHIIELDDPKNDLEELKISDDIQGAMVQIGMLIGKMQQINAKSLPTMGQMPELASTTATAVGEAGAHSNIRSNYKSLTFEFTFLLELYQMIMFMSYQFAASETAVKLMGDKVYDFDPESDYIYKPLSQSIESEYQKAGKRKEYIQLVQALMQSTNPKAPVIVNLLLAQIFKLSGDEFEVYANALLDEDASVTAGQGQEPADAIRGGGPSNQTGIPMSTTEEGVRGI